ncbi:hypothetical protein [Priestia megaterium]|uniref:hypothetical protein n=1 Tax=Priestia megaterium TaxID=1404 RepID=UPI0011557F0C|nr:hypothetical protein [Priestia megaterium]
MRNPMNKLAMKDFRQRVQTFFEEKSYLIPAYKFISKRFFKWYKADFIMVLFVSVVIVLGLFAQSRIHGGGINNTFWLSLIPNAIMDMVGIIISTYLVSRLTAYSQEQKQKRILADIFGTKLITLTELMMIDYVFFLSEGKEWKLTHGHRDKLIKYLSGIAKNATTLITYEKLMNDIQLNVNDINLMPNCFIHNWEDINAEIQLMMEYREKGQPARVHNAEYINIVNGKIIRLDRTRLISGVSDSAAENIKNFYEEFELVLPIEIKRSLQSIKDMLKEQGKFYQNVEGYRLIAETNISKEMVPLIQKRIINLTQETAKEIVYIWNYFKI